MCYCFTVERVQVIYHVLELWHSVQLTSGSSGMFHSGIFQATLPGAWHYRVSAGTGWPTVSIL